MAQKTFFAVKDLDGDGKHYCAVSFEVSWRGKLSAS